MNDDKPFPPIEMFEVLASTLDSIHQAAGDGAPEWTTHIALEQAAHGVLAAKVAFNLHANGALSVGELEAELFQEGLGEPAVTAARVCFGLGLHVDAPQIRSYFLQEQNSISV